MLHPLRNLVRRRFPCDSHIFRAYTRISGKVPGQKTHHHCRNLISISFLRKRNRELNRLKLLISTLGLSDRNQEVVFSLIRIPFQSRPHTNRSGPRDCLAQDDERLVTSCPLFRYLQCRDCNRHKMKHCVVRNQRSKRQSSCLVSPELLSLNKGRLCLSKSSSNMPCHQVVCLMHVIDSCRESRQMGF